MKRKPETPPGNVRGGLYDFVMQLSLLDVPREEQRESLAAGAWVLRGFAFSRAEVLLQDVEAVSRAAPFRNMDTPGGYTMSVAMTNCGELGWVTDSQGYRYAPEDPLTQKPWPAMPESFLKLAVTAAAEAGYPDFKPDACLINRYQPRARMSLHQDKNERDESAPIVSVSLGVPAIFLFGGDKRTDKPLRIPLHHGDVVVWGGLSRYAFHGVAPLKKDTHAATGSHRINLTFRKARD